MCILKTRSYEIFRYFILLMMLVVLLACGGTGEIQAGAEPLESRTKASSSQAGTKTLGRVTNLEVSYPSYGVHQIHWKQVKGASGYLIYRRKDVSWKRIGQVEEEASSFSYCSSERFPIVEGDRYTYSVRAYRSVDGVIDLGPRSKSVQGLGLASDDKAIVGGWKTEEGARFYYRDGTRVFGWKKIGKKWYYFDPVTKKLQTNTIAGDSSGYYYVDGDGIRVTDRVVKKAVSAVRKHTHTGDGRKKILKACYQYIVKDCVYRAYEDKESIKKMPQYAWDMFSNKAGNCYRGAAALAYMAKVLGFEARVAVGEIAVSKGMTLHTHGWTEIKIDGKWYICDTSMQRYYPDAHLFLVSKKQYPFYLVWQNKYLLKIQNGKVAWKKQQKYLPVVIG